MAPNASAEQIHLNPHGHWLCRVNFPCFPFTSTLISQLVILRAAAACEYPIILVLKSMPVCMPGASLGHLEYLTH